MSAPGRNDPCSCGSGRKFKHCCGRAAAAATPPITDDDRAVAYDSLERLARLRFASDLSRAAELISEDNRLPSPLDDPDDDLSVGRFLDWFAFDVVLHTGRTLAEEALHNRAADFTPGARRLLAELRGAPWRLLQVKTQFFGGVAVVCRDLLDATATYRIQEPCAELARHDVLIARPVNRAGWFVIEGDPAVIDTSGDKRKLVRALLRLRREAARQGTSPELQRMMEGAALLRLMTAAESVRDETLDTIEGDPVEPVTVWFHVRRRAELLSALRRADDFEAMAGENDSRDALHFNWVETAAASRYALAVLTVDGAAARVDAFSQRRAERARTRLLELGQGLVEFERIESAPVPHSLHRG
jgi:hypothetical protein